METSKVQEHLNLANLNSDIYCDVVLNIITETEETFITKIKDIFINSKLEESGFFSLQSIWMIDQTHAYEYYKKDNSLYSVDIMSQKSFIYGNLSYSAPHGKRALHLRLATQISFEGNFYAYGKYCDNLLELFKTYFLPHLKTL